jgi:C-terminal processing protease CtpA/Prc
MGWTPDGKSVLFSSNRNSSTGRYTELFAVARTGGFPTPLPLPIAGEGSYSPDGAHIAYVPVNRAFSMWKGYRGGETTPIWIAKLADSTIEKLPRENSNDFNPMWVDDRIFFLSDRDGAVTLFSYDTRRKTVVKAVNNDGLDLKSACAGPGAIVYEQFGAIHLYDLKTGKSRPVDIRIAADLPAVRPHFVKVATRIRNAALSPTGARAVFEARGEILTVPAEKGDIRNLTNTPGANERNPAWSPDGRRIAFFSDESGEYALHFTASTNSGESLGLDVHAVEHTATSSIYLAVLDKTQPSPFAPESDEEKPADEKKPADDKKPDAAAPKSESLDDTPAETPKPPEAAGHQKTAAAEVKDTKIDLDGIDQRILSVPMPPGRYTALEVGKAGILLALEAPAPGAAIPAEGAGPSGFSVRRYDFKARKTDVPLEWKQMYHEAFRLERDFFYDPGFHGFDLAAAEKFYEPYLEGIGARVDLNYLFEEALGGLTVGHLRVGGGDFAEVPHVTGGLLGADYTIENGRYRFARVYDGENWNPQLRAPLTQPGVNVVAGEYLLAVNGQEVRATDEVYSFFEGTANRTVRLRVGPDPGGAGSREVKVVPVASEQGLRNLAWVEENRRTVDRLSHGRLAYIYLPDTAASGYTFFNRYFFPQAGREGAVVDERFNGGGTMTDYILTYLQRRLLNYRTTRDGEDTTWPVSLIPGPKAMIVNEYAGSGGDAMPFHFRELSIGPLIGKRTWGGLVGMAGGPPLMDGGFVGAPSSGIYNPLTGEWEVENAGVAPDIEVEQDPALVRQGHDPQLEKAVAVALEALKKNPPPTLRHPAFPNYYPAAGH